MSTERDVTRIVRSWMGEGATQLPDRVLDAVLDQLPATPQRQAGWLARRFSLMNNNIVRLGLAAAAVAVVAIVGINLLGPGPGPGSLPEATPTPSAAAPSPAATPQSLPAVIGSELTAGTYYLPDFPVGVAFTVSGRGWQACSESPVEQSLCYYPGEDFGGQLGFLIVSNVAADPCSPGEVLLDPPVGPSVDDLVTAISSLEGYEISIPIDTSVDGFSGKLMTVTAPSDSGCNGFAPWATEDRTTGMLPGETNVLRIIDVAGVRVMITTSFGPESLFAAAFDEVLDSVQITP